MGIMLVSLTQMLDLQSYLFLSSPAVSVFHLCDKSVVQCLGF